MTTPTLGSILLASRDPDRLRQWYIDAFGVQPNGDGFFEWGGVAVLVDGRDDVAEQNLEPARVILNFHVDDAVATAAHLDTMGVEWLVEVVYRPENALWFATLLDPDGNCIQLIQLTDEYLARRAADGRLARGCRVERLSVEP